jgi:hypothetical protein
MSDPDVTIGRLRFQLAVMSFAAANLQNFSAELIGIRSWRRLRRKDVAQAKVQCLRDSENFGMFGVPIEQETKVLWEGRRVLEHYIDQAIAKAWQNQK